MPTPPAPRARRASRRRASIVHERSRGGVTTVRRVARRATRRAHCLQMQRSANTPNTKVSSVADEGRQAWLPQQLDAVERESDRERREEQAAQVGIACRHGRPSRRRCARAACRCRSSAGATRRVRRGARLPSTMAAAIGTRNGAAPVNASGRRPARSAALASATDSAIAAAERPRRTSSGCRSTYHASSGPLRSARSVPWNTAATKNSGVDCATSKSVKLRDRHDRAGDEHATMAERVGEAARRYLERGDRQRVHDRDRADGCQRQAARLHVQHADRCHEADRRPARGRQQYELRAVAHQLGGRGNVCTIAVIVFVGADEGGGSVR